MQRRIVQIEKSESCLTYSSTLPFPVASCESSRASFEETFWSVSLTQPRATLYFACCMLQPLTHHFSGVPILLLYYCLLHPKPV